MVSDWFAMLMSGQMIKEETSMESFVGVDLHKKNIAVLLGIMFHMLKDRIDYQEFLKHGSNAQ